MDRLLLFALFAVAAASNFTIPQSELDPPTLGTSGMLEQAIPWIITGLFAAFLSLFDMKGLGVSHSGDLASARYMRGL